MIERRTYIPDMKMRKTHDAADDMRTSELKRRKFRVPTEATGGPMREYRKLIENIESGEMKPGDFLKSLLRFLEEEAAKDFFNYIKNRDLQSIKKVISNIGKYFPIYSQALEDLSKEFFSDPNKINWEEIDSSFAGL